MKKWKYKVVSIATSGLTPAALETLLNNNTWEVIFMQVLGLNLIIVAKKLITK